MASDEELARHVSRLEDRCPPAESQISDELDEYRTVAGEVHDELARRIERVGEEAANTDDLAAVVERLDCLEKRLDSLEKRLDGLEKRR